MDEDTLERLTTALESIQIHMWVLVELLKQASYTDEEDQRFIRFDAKG